MVLSAVGLDHETAVQLATKYLSSVPERTATSHLASPR
jgi:hypothetical protein